MTTPTNILFISSRFIPHMAEETERIVGTLGT